MEWQHVTMNIRIQNYANMQVLGRWQVDETKHKYQEYLRDYSLRSASLGNTILIEKVFCGN